MYQYKDYNYVNNVLNLPYEEGLEVYLKCIGRFDDNMLWDMFLVNCFHGYEHSFEDFKKEMVGKTKGKNLNKEEKDQEEKRIIDNTKSIIALDKERRRKENAKRC